MHHEDDELVGLSNAVLLLQYECIQPQCVNARQTQPVQRHHSWNATAFAVLPVLEEYRKHLNNESISSHPAILIIIAFVSFYVCASSRMPTPNLSKQQEGCRKGQVCCALRPNRLKHHNQLKQQQAQRHHLNQAISRLSHIDCVSHAPV